MEVRYNTNYMNSVLDYEYFQELKNKEWFRAKKLEVEELADATILPYMPNETREVSWGKGGVVDVQGAYCALSASINRGRCEENRMTGSYEYNPDTLAYLDETVIYAGLIIYHYGHFIIDCMNRFWYLIKDNTHLKIAYLPEDERTITGVYLEFFKLAGIEEDRLIAIDRPTRVKGIIIPEASSLPGEYYTREYKETFDYIREQCPPDKSKIEKIYFSRTALLTSFIKERGEREIVPEFRKAGYKVIEPEKYTLRQQISLIRSCKELVTISGTLPHNLLFGEDGTRLIILFKTYENNIHQFMVDHIRALDVTQIDCYYSLFPTNIGKGPFIIYKNENLTHFFEDAYHRNISPSKYLPVYVEWYLKKFFRFNDELRNNINPFLLYDYFSKQVQRNWFDIRKYIRKLQYMFGSIPYNIKMNILFIATGIRRNVFSSKK